MFELKKVETVFVLMGSRLLREAVKVYFMDSSRVKCGINLIKLEALFWAPNSINRTGRINKHLKVLSNYWAELFGRSPILNKSELYKFGSTFGDKVKT